MFSSCISRRSILARGAALALSPLALGSLARTAYPSAPMLGPWQPKHFRFKFGEFEITVISDSEVFINGPYPLIGQNGSEAEVSRLMHDNMVSDRQYQPGFFPTVVNTGKELILFDTGNGANGFVPRPDGGWLAAQLGPAGFKAEDIDIVVLTHGHPDHVGGLMENGKPLFPNARYVIGQVDYDFWSTEAFHREELKGMAAVFRLQTQDIVDKIRFIKPGDTVVSGIQAVEAYGHTPGHMVFHIESEGKEILFWGDCAHHHVASLARPDWHVVFDVDKEKGAKTRKRIFDMVATDRLFVLGYHMPFPAVGHVEKLDRSGYRWVAHSYQFNL